MSSRGHFYKHDLTLISAWISKYMLIKAWDEIPDPFQNLQMDK